MFNLFNKKTTRTRSRRFDRPRRPSKTTLRAKRETRFRIIKMVSVIAIPMLMVTLAYPYIIVKMNEVKADIETNCYQNMPDQKFTASIMDDATTNLFSEPAQMRALKTSYMDEYTLMAPNQRLDVFTTGREDSSGIASPVYSVCKPASTVAQYAALKQHQPNIPDMSQPQLTHQANKAKEAFAQKIDELIARSQSHKTIWKWWDAPLFQTFKSVSRYYHMRGQRIDHLMTFSAGIEVSHDAYWCKNRNALPLWRNFKKRPVYRDIKPFKSFDGMKVTFLMPNILSFYPEWQWCTTREIQNFWRGYFLEAKAQEPDIQTLNYRPAAVKQQKERQQERGS